MGSDRAHRRAAHRRGGRDRACGHTRRSGAARRRHPVQLRREGKRDGRDRTGHGVRRAPGPGERFGAGDAVDPGGHPAPGIARQGRERGRRGVTAPPRPRSGHQHRRGVAGPVAHVRGRVDLGVADRDRGGAGRPGQRATEHRGRVGFGDRTTARAARPEHPRGRAETGGGAARRSRRGRSTGREAARMAVAGAGRTGVAGAPRRAREARGTGQRARGCRQGDAGALGAGRSARRRVGRPDGRGDRGGVAAARGLGGRRVGRVRWRAAGLRHRRAAAGRVGTGRDADHRASCGRRSIPRASRSSRPPRIPTGSTPGCATRSCATGNYRRSARRREATGAARGAAAQGADQGSRAR